MQLPTRHVRSHDLRGSVELCVKRGTLWVSVEGEPEDLMLNPGDCLRRKVRGRMVVQAMADADYEICDRPRAA
jgi:hypothetical protein